MPNEYKKYYKKDIKEFKASTEKFQIKSVMEKHLNSIKLCLKGYYIYLF